MKYSTKLSDTVHVMVLIAINQEKSLSQCLFDLQKVSIQSRLCTPAYVKTKKSRIYDHVAGHARSFLFKTSRTISHIAGYL